MSGRRLQNRARFLLRPAWILDWMIVMGCLAHAFGDIESVRKLKL